MPLAQERKLMELVNALRVSKAHPRLKLSILVVARDYAENSELLKRISSFSAMAFRFWISADRSVF